MRAGKNSSSSPVPPGFMPRIWITGRVIICVSWTRGQGQGSKATRKMITPKAPLPHAGEGGARVSGRGRVPPPAIIVHSLAQALAPAPAASALGTPLVLRSAAGAGGTVGVGWFVALAAATA